MSLLLPTVIAFTVGTLFSWVEFRTSTYPNTGFLISFKRPVLIYCAIYGIAALAGFFLSNFLIAQGKLKIEGLDSNSPYIVAIVLGLSAKAIMQLNIYTVTTGSTPFPIGFQTITQLFEPFLLRSILLEEFNAVRNFVAPYATKFADLDTVKKMIEDNIPASLSQQEQVVIKSEIEKYQQVHEVMERFLRFIGRNTFVRVFK